MPGSAHGGSIAAWNNPGRGSSLVVTLPASFVLFGGAANRGIAKVGASLRD
jgi:hypothetical protein